MNVRRIAVLFLLMFASGQGPLRAQGANPPAGEESEGFLESLARKSGLRSKAVDSADFVRDSRPSEMNFTPVHAKRPETPGKLLTSDELQAKERELDALKASHDQIAKRPTSKVAYKPIQAPGASKAPAPVAPEAPQPLKVEIPTNR